MPQLVADLQHFSAYPFPTREVELVETHISWLFLAGPFAYKVKKPVKLGFLDYSTLERRREFCEAEVRLNGRLAPDVYIGVVPVTRWGDAVRFEGTGEAVDYAVKMRRLPKERMLDQLLGANKVSVADVQRLAVHIAEFHTAARTGPGVDEFGSLRLIEQNWHENFEQVRPFEGKSLSHAQLAEVYGFVRQEVDRLAPVFESRVREGRIRDCHGDLRSESVWMADDGRFRVFDCIEFNERFRYSDVASEVAFLASDLDWRGQPHLAWSWVDAYVEASGDAGLLAVLPFYKCYRAVVRGKVEAMEQTVDSVEERAQHARFAREHFQLAEWYSLRFAPTLILTCGQVASGKTTVARGVGSILNLPVISSDRLRKQMAGMAPMEHQAARVDSGLYALDVSRRTYDQLYRRAAELLRSGQSVVLDATFNQASERERAIQLARASGAGFLILKLDAPESVIYQRLAARQSGSITESDAGIEVFEHIRTRFEAPGGLLPQNLLHLPAEKSIQDTVRSAVEGIRQRVPPAQGLRRIA